MGTWRSRVNNKKVKERAGERERERERHGDQALMEQRCFNDFSVCIYRL